MAGRLAGRRILITGAAAGIGLAIARLFAEEGARVALVDRDAGGLDAACRALGDAAVAATADVSDGEAVRGAVAAAADGLGGLDGIVNSAGIAPARPLAELGEDEFARILQVNLHGPFRVAQAALPHLRAAGGGTIVSIASTLGLRPVPGRGAYSISKAGLIMLGKALALELAADGVRVNTICPGRIELPAMEAEATTSEAREARMRAMGQNVAMKRLGFAAEVARTALFLTSDESSLATGSTLVIDGGAAFH
jgi:NAD(P)-dependent dehydrogenase (short-subunit alcohol dehydrogenase family)